jgi:hypothetical protein
VKIETLDNPGWTVEIDLAETDLEGRQFTEINQLGSERDWIHCKVEDRKFFGNGGAPMLEPILRTFLEWAATRRSG